MKSFNKHKEEYALAIAKSYLQNVGLEQIKVGSNKSNDFIITQNSNLNRKIVVDVKASKYTLTDIKRAYKGLWTKYKQRKDPTLLMYINYENKKGFFHILANGSQTEIKELNIPTLKKSLSQDFN